MQPYTDAFISWRLARSSIDLQGFWRFSRDRCAVFIVGLDQLGIVSVAQ